MNLERILPFSHSLIRKATSQGDIVIDATAGNGNDTLFLAKLVGPTGKVFGFDIQMTAIERTTARLQEEKADENVQLFHAGHERIKELLPNEVFGKVKGAIFNLGYLPKGDHSIITTPNTTISAIEQLVEIMSPEGIIVLVIYHGHPGGEHEKDTLIDYVRQLDQQTAHVLLYQFMNQKNNAPFIIAIEKR